MATTLDGQSLFDEQDLEIKCDSLRRDSMERTIPGLDGVLSIDLGVRSRNIKQNGMLNAKSRAQMENRLNLIRSFIDGNTHTLETRNGEKFNDLRVDAFRVIKEQISGSGITVNYEIAYTQLVA